MTNKYTRRKKRSVSRKTTETSTKHKKDKSKLKKKRSSRKTYKHKSIVGGADPDNFFKGSVMTMDEFVNSYCLIFSDNKGMYAVGDVDGKPFDKWKTGLFRVDIENKVSDIKELFDSDENFYKCLRTFMLMEIFIQDDFDEFLKFQSIIESVKLKLKSKHGHTELYTKFIHFVKKLSKSALEQWVNMSLTMYARNRNSTMLENIIKRIKPEYYYHIMTTVRLFKTSFLVEKRTGEKERIEDILSDENRKFIYKTMSKEARIDTFQDMVTKLFNIDQYIQINYNINDYVSSNVNDAVSYFSQGVKYLPFTTNIWDIHFIFNKMKLYDYNGLLYEVITNRKKENSQEDNFMPSGVMGTLIEAFYGEGFNRGGWEFILLTGKDDDNMDSNSGNEQTVYYRHQSLSSREPSFLQGFLLDHYNENDNINDYNIKKYEVNDGSMQTDGEKNSDVPRILLHHYIYNLLTPPGVVNKKDDIIDVTEEIQSNQKSEALVDLTTTNNTSSQPIDLTNDEVENISDKENIPADEVENISDKESNPADEFENISDKEKNTEQDTDDSMLGGERNVDDNENNPQTNNTNVYNIDGSPVNTSVSEEVVTPEKNKKSVTFVTNEKDEVKPVKVNFIHKSIMYDSMKIMKEINNRVQQGERPQTVINEFGKAANDKLNSIGDYKSHKFFQAYLAIHAESIASSFVKGGGLFSMAQKDDTSIDTLSQNHSGLPLSDPTYGNLYRFLSLHDLDEPSKFVKNDRINIFQGPNTPARVTYQTPNSPIETAGVVKPPTTGPNPLENTDLNENIYTHTRKSAMDIFKHQSMGEYGFTRTVPKSQFLEYTSIIPPELRDAYFVYKTEEEAKLKYPDDNYVLNGKSPGAYAMIIDKKKMDEIIKFIDARTKGLLSSDSMKTYLSVITQNIQLGNTTELTNYQKGYIYNIHVDLFHLGGPNNITAGTLPHMPLFKVITVTGIHNIELDSSVEKESILIWNNPSSAMRRQIRLGAPRLFYGFLKNIWNGIDNDIKDPLATISGVPASPEPVSAVAVTPSEEVSSVPSAPLERPSDSSESTESSELSLNEDELEKKEEAKIIAEENKKSSISPDQPIPRTMSVNVTTTIPGFQEFKLEPKMLTQSAGTNDKNKDKVVRINPQIKLTNKSVNDVPDDIILKKQFFDAHLFTTLNNRIASENTFGLQPLALDVAVKRNIVDHNVKVTLDALFKPKTQIYLGGKPYTIYSAEYNDTDWKLAPKDIVETDLTAANIIDSQVINIQEKEGSKEMRDLPDIVKRGDGNNEFIPINQKDKKAIVPEVKIVEPVVVNGTPLTPIKTEPEPEIKVEPEVKIEVKEEKTSAAIPTSTAIVKYEPKSPVVLHDDTQVKKKIIHDLVTQAARIDIPEKNTDFKQKRVSDISNKKSFERVAKLRNFFLQGFKSTYYRQDENGDYTKEITRYSQTRYITKEQMENIKETPHYYNLLNMLYNETTNMGKMFANVFKMGKNKSITSNELDGKVFNLNNYKNEQIKLLQIIESVPDGNCFYECISNSFNLHNAYENKGLYQNPKGKDTGEIVYSIKDETSQQVVERRGTEYTPEFIRYAIVNYNRKRENYPLFLSRLLTSQFNVYGYDETMRWIKSQKSFWQENGYGDPTDNILIKDIISVNDAIYNQSSEVHLNLNEEYNAKNRPSGFFSEHSNHNILLYMSEDPKHEDDPLQVHRDINDIEDYYMSKNYYATDYEISVVEKIFNLNIISIVEDNKVLMKPRNDGTNKQERTKELYEEGSNNNQVKHVRSGFSLINAGLENNNSEEAKKYNKTVFIHFVGNNHYDLVVFDHAADKDGKSIRQGGTRKNNKHKLRKTAKARDVSGGATEKFTEIKYTNRKKAIFFNRLHSDKNFNEVEQMIQRENVNPENLSKSDLRLPRFDNMTMGFPMYMVLFIYSQYNRFDARKNRDMNELYKRFPMYFLEFTTLDAIISHMSSNDRDDFKELYNRVFGREYDDSFISQQSVIELSSSEDSGDESPTDILGGATILTTNVRDTHPIGSINKDVLNIMNDRQSNLSFHVKVHLTLMPGEVINPSNVPSLACESRMQSIKMNWSKILDRPYYPTPRKLESKPIKKEGDDDKDE